ncbi:hypothetical protein SPB21_34050 [Leptothoe sp. ISB3NOV94-8A]
MYEQVERSKENKSRAVANSVAQRKKNTKQGFGFVDNRPEAIMQRKVQEVANSSQQEEKNAQLQTTTDNNTELRQQTIQKQIDIDGVLATEDEIAGLNQDEDVNRVLLGWIDDGPRHVFRDWVQAIVFADKLLRYEEDVEHFEDVLRHSMSIPPYLPDWFIKRLNEIDEHIQDCLGEEFQEFTVMYIDQEMLRLHSAMARAKDQAREVEENENNPEVPKSPDKVIAAIVREAQKVDFTVAQPDPFPRRFDTGYYGSGRPNGRIKTEDLEAVKTGWKNKVISVISTLKPFQLRTARSGSNENIWDFQIELWDKGSSKFRPVFNFHIIYK